MLVLTVRHSEPPPGGTPQVGQNVELRQQDGRAVPARITDVTESSVTFDANHTLARQTLTFDIRMLEVAQYFGE